MAFIAPFPLSVSLSLFLRVHSPFLFFISHYLPSICAPLFSFLCSGFPLQLIRLHLSAFSSIQFFSWVSHPLFRTLLLPRYSAFRNFAPSHLPPPSHRPPPLISTVSSNQSEGSKPQRQLRITYSLSLEKRIGILIDYWQQLHRLHYNLVEKQNRFSWGKENERDMMKF